MPANPKELMFPKSRVYPLENMRFLGLAALFYLQHISCLAKPLIYNKIAFWLHIN